MLPPDREDEANQCNPLPSQIPTQLSFPGSQAPSTPGELFDGYRLQTLFFSNFSFMFPISVFFKKFNFFECQKLGWLGIFWFFSDVTTSVFLMNLLMALVFCRIWGPRDNHTLIRCVPVHCFQKLNILTSMYAYRTPNPKHNPKYTKAIVLHTQDKQHVSWAAS